MSTCNQLLKRQVMITNRNEIALITGSQGYKTVIRDAETRCEHHVKRHASLFGALRYFEKVSRRGRGAA